jgi:hypothetical protein
MAIDKKIYNNGINGRLSYWEIESLPSDYEGLKSMFKDATRRKNMSGFEKEKRMLQVLTRATYGMKREKAYVLCDEYGNITKWQKFKMKLKFIFDIKGWWNIFMLKRELKKKWRENGNE